MPTMISQILRLPRVLEACGKGRSSHYADISAGLFTKPVPIGARAVGWPANEVQAINAARIAGKPEGDIRALVSRLEESRKVAA